MLAPGGRRVWDLPGSRPRRHARTHAPFPLSFPCAKRGGGQARAERAASDQRFMESMRIATSGRRACLSRAFTAARRSEEHTSELQSLLRTSSAVFCLKQKRKKKPKRHHTTYH